MAPHIVQPLPAPSSQPATPRPTCDRPVLSCPTHPHHTALQPLSLTITARPPRLPIPTLPRPTFPCLFCPLRSNSWVAQCFESIRSNKTATLIHPLSAAGTRTAAQCRIALHGYSPEGRGGGGGGVGEFVQPCGGASPSFHRPPSPVRPSRSARPPGLPQPCGSAEWLCVSKRTARSCSFISSYWRRLAVRVGSAYIIEPDYKGCGLHTGMDTLLSTVAYLLAGAGCAFRQTVWDSPGTRLEAAWTQKCHPMQSPGLKIGM